MAVTPHNADIVVKDLPRALAFYRLLGLDIPAEADAHDVGAQGPFNYEPAHGMALGFFTEAVMAGSPMGWAEPVGSRISLAFKCDTAAEVDAICAAAATAGHPVVMEPVDSPWGQRYACLRDPDGTRVDLFADKV